MSFPGPNEAVCYRNRINMEILDFTRTGARYCVQAYTVYTCLRAKGIIALIMHLLGRDAGNKDPVSTMGSDGSNSEIRFHPRFKPEGAANSRTCLYSE